MEALKGSRGTNNPGLGGLTHVSTAESNSARLTL